MRIALKTILRKHGYPPDMEAKATETVLEEAKLLADQFTEGNEVRYPTLDGDDDVFEGGAGVR